MKKLSNKILIAVLVGLVGIFALSRWLRSPGLEGNVKKELLSLDTASINEVRIKPANHKPLEIVLKKEAGKWKVFNNQLQAETEIGTVKSMLGVLKDLKAQRLASRKKDKWDTYQVGESGTLVSVFQNGKQTDIHFGKSNYGQGGATTFVRIGNKDEVYVVEGFLDSHFNRTYNDWRNKTFLKLNQSEISKVIFNYAADSSFVLEKKDSVWSAANQKAEDGKVNSFLGQLAFKTFNDFADGFASSEKSTAVLQIESKNGVLATVQGWKNGEQWILTSTLQNGVYFSANQSLAKDFLVGKGKFLADKALK
jgi:dipeptidyl aminopeptidase/acylaminoacyl peptidase